MRMSGIFVALLSAVLLATVAQSTPITLGSQPKPQQPTGPRTGDKVSFCGKVVPLVEIGCVGIVGGTDTVDLTDVKPQPPTGKIVSGVGSVNAQPNICMQGMRITAATWKEVTSCN